MMFAFFVNVACLLVELVSQKTKFSSTTASYFDLFSVKKFCGLWCKILKHNAQRIRIGALFGPSIFTLQRPSYFVVVPPLPLPLFPSSSKSEGHRPHTTEDKRRTT